MTAPEPTIADVLARIDGLGRRLDDVSATLGLEIRAAKAELQLSIVTLTQAVHDLDHAMRDLWTEHLSHSHPEEPS